MQASAETAVLPAFSSVPNGTGLALSTVKVPNRVMKKSVNTILMVAVLTGLRKAAACEHRHHQDRIDTFFHDPVGNFHS